MFVRSRPAITLLTILALVAPAASGAQEAGLPKPRPVPLSPWSKVFYGYADAILKSGRDTHGPQKTGLILSALDLPAMTPLAARPAAPAGLRQATRAGAADGPLVGANPLHDQNLLRVLYLLSETSAKPVYRDAAAASRRYDAAGNKSFRASFVMPWTGGES